MPLPRGQESYRQAVASFSASADDVDEFLRITGDAKLTEDGRRQLLTSIRERLDARHQATVDNLESFVVGARRDYRALLPEELERAAAFQNPRRPVEISALYGGPNVPVSELPPAIELAVAAKDVAAAHALRQILRNRAADLDAVGGAALFRALDVVTADGREAALAELVAVQHVLAQLRAVGPLGTIGDAAPGSMLEAARVAAQVPDGQGGTRTLSSAEIEKYLKLAGVPLAPPVPTR